MPRIFISHSSKTDLARDVRDRIVAELRRLGPTIQLDEECIEPGEEFRPKILQWLATCHGAVIIFSKEALEKSVWVRLETLVLCWRRALNANIRIVPVLIDGVDETHSRMADFEPVRLGDIKFVKPEPGLTKKKLSKDIARKVAEAFRGFDYADDNDDTQRWAATVADGLSGMDMSLEHFARDVGIPLAALQGNEKDKRAIIARHLLHSKPTVLFNALDLLARQLRAGSTRGDVLARLFPAWVPGDAVRNIPLVLKREGIERNLMVRSEARDRGEARETLDDCIDRATGCHFDRTPIVVEDTHGAGGAAELLDPYRKRAMMSIDPRWAEERPPSPEEIVKYRGFANRRQNWISMMIFHDDAIRLGVPKELRKEWEGLLFVLLTADEGIGSEDWGLSNLERVAPEYAELTESDIRLWVRNLKNR